MRNVEFLSKEDHEKLQTLKEIIHSKCLKTLGESLPDPLINHICSYIDLSKQYSITPVSSKRYMEKNIYNGYSQSKGEELDVITRYRVTKIAGDIKPGYRRNTKIIYEAKIKSKVCVVCMQEFTQGYDKKYMRDVGYNLMIYFRKED